MAERKALRPGLTARDVTVLGLATALVFSLQIAMAGLPNIEPVSLLILLYTLYFRKKTLLVIYAFALLEGVWHGFHLWWVMYLYVWTILWAVVMLLSRKGRRHGAFFWAVVSGLGGWRVSPLTSSTERGTLCWPWCSFIPWIGSCPPSGWGSICRPGTKCRRDGIFLS